MQVQELRLPPAVEADHARRVARVVRQLRERGPHAGPISLRKRAVAHQVPKALDRRTRDRKVDIGELDRILHIDPQRRLCVAEPGVTFVDLVEATLPHGLVPVVVPELKTITVGGAVAGCSIESTSFHEGGFHDSCLEYEVITAAGEVLTCRPDNELQLVFHMVHGAFGTLGILSRLTFRLMPAQPFVRVDYERHERLDSYLASIRAHRAAGDVDFMDGIIHSPRLHVLSLGRFAERAPYTHRYDWMRVYWESTGQRREDYLRTQDYFFRYDRGVTNVWPRSFVGRLLLGKLTGSTQVLGLAERLRWLLPREQPGVTVDLFLPASRAGDFLDWHQAALGHYPLWCVPYQRRDYPWISPAYWRGVEDDLYLDIAIYGMRQRPGQNAYRLLEEKLFELDGLKSLISHNYYSEDEFWSIWDRPNHQAVKALTDPQGLFRDLYAKTCRAAMGLD
mgnify:CR=1 FL=1